MQATQVRVAMVQEAPVFLNLEASCTRALAAINRATDQGAQIVVFPETWCVGYPVWLDLAPKAAMWAEPGASKLFQILMEQALVLGEQASELLRELAMERQVYVVMGAHERDGDRLYNSQIFYQPDGAVFCHRKLMPTYGERLIWARGDGSSLDRIETPWGGLGGLICWEHWMPLARAALHALGERIHVAQWPAVGELHQVASRHYAFEGSCFVIAAGCVLTKTQILADFDACHQDEAARALLASMPEGYLRDGGSAVIGPDGEYCLQPQYETQSLPVIDLDLSACLRARLVLDSDGHYARPDVFQLSVNRAPQTGVSFTDRVDSQ